MITADKFFALSTAIVKAFAPTIVPDEFDYCTEFMDGYYDSYDECPGIILGFGSRTKAQLVYVELIGINIDQSVKGNWDRLLTILELTELSGNQLSKITVQGIMSIDKEIVLKGNYGTLCVGRAGLLNVELVLNEGALTRLFVAHSVLLRENVVEHSDAI